MKSSISFVVLMLVALFVYPVAVPAQKVSKSRAAMIPTAKCQSDGLSNDEVTEILRAHNLVRAEHKVASVAWDCALERSAQKWANKAVTQHDEDTLFGESIFVASASNQSVGTVVVRWMAEQPNWDNRHGRCAPGKVCNHYTQLVWRASRKIGCGVNRAGAGKWKVFVVCHYDPAGNTGGPAY